MAFTNLVRLTSTSSHVSSAPSLPSMRQPPKLHLLVAATGPRDVSWALPLVVRLCKEPHIEMRAVVDEPVPRLSQTIIVIENRGTDTPTMPSTLPWASASASASISVSETPATLDNVDSDNADFNRQQAFDLVEWADLLVLAPIGADGIAKMLAGVADTLLGEVLRGWDTAKKIMMVPGMSTHAWRNCMTQKHLSKIQRKWGWIRTLTPILWHYEGVPNAKRVASWNGFDELVSLVRNQADLLCLGREVDVAVHSGPIPSSSGEVRTALAPEIWSVIFEYIGDWELAQALGVHTSLPMPPPWKPHPPDPSCARQVYEHELDWTVLTADPAAICRKISQSPAGFQDLSALVTRLIIRFGLVGVLEYLEANRPTLFRAFDGRVLPTTASAYYARPEVLDYWKQSRWFRDRHATCYDAEAVDGASMNGHVRVLEWWWRSGLPLRYSESALEQASGNGHVLVLTWWRDVAAQDERVVLRPGRSLLWAAQHGRVDVLRWWDASCIPVSHSDGVAKMASRWGQVGVLELWRQLKGDDKLVSEGDDVLVGPTMHAHIEVLEWWRGFARGELPGMDGRKQRVEYRTCDIEEALEDSIGDQRKVRAWWKENGLNLGLRNMEWMKTRCL